MAVSDWSTNPALNTTIDGVNIGENCPPANLNNMGRSIMASVRVMYDGLPVVSDLMPVAGGTFSGTQPKYDSEGAFLHNASSGATSGRVFYLVEGSADPAGLANGDLILYYAA